MGAVEVQGTVSAAGELTLTGNRAHVATVSWTDDPSLAVSKFRLVRAEGQVAGGEISLDSDFNWPDRLTHVIQGGNIQSFAWKAPLSVLQGFRGTWTGNYVTRSCVATGGQACVPTVPGETATFRLTLEPTSEATRGTLDGIGAVTAVTSGATLVLAGAPSQPGASYQATILSWTSQQDEFGVLRGAFTYLRESTGRTSTFAIDLNFVVKVFEPS